jgi:paraquat-inducible protein B
MVSKANPLVIGIFGIGAIVLLIVSILFFGTTRWLKATEKIVVFFEESVNGLDLGAPVKFNGVPIGEVVGIHLSLDADESQAEIPVILSVDEKRLREVLGVAKDQDFKNVCEKAVSRGLRARLQYQSFVTGLLFVDLGYYPYAKTPKALGNNHFDHAVVPPASSGLGEVWKTASTTFARISEVDFIGISREFHSLLKGLNQGIHSVHFKDWNDKFIKVLDDAHGFLQSPQLRSAVEAMNGTFTQLNAQIQPLAEDWHDTLEEARLGIEQLKSTFHQVDGLLDPNQVFRYELESAIKSFRRASEAIERLADTLEQNPASLLVGKP